MPTEASKLPYVEFLKALGKGNVDDRVSLLKSAIAKAGLSPEQEALADLLFTLHDEGNEPAGGDESIGYDESSTGEPPDPSFRDRKKTANMRQEVADLREVNDTLAAALGACQYCWGGNSQCGACEGRGHAGCFAPDTALFKELVMPAVRRMFALGRASRRASSTRNQKGDRLQQPRGS